jgi:hypothetical protein
MANRYWVGNSGNWSDTAHWSTTSGGAGGASVPGSTDDAIFNASSFSLASQTVTINSGGFRMCNNLDLTGVTNTPTFAFQQYVSLSIYGSMTLVSGMNFSFGGYNYIRLKASSGSHTVTSAGKLICGMWFEGNAGSGGTWTFQDDFSFDDTYGLNYSGITIEAGTVDLNGKTIETPFFIISSVYATSIVFGAANVTITADGYFHAGGSLTTIDAGTSSISFAAGSYLFLNDTDVELYDVVGEDGFTLTGNYADQSDATLTVHDFTLDNGNQEVTLGANMTVEGTFTANDSSNQFFIHGKTLSDTVTINAATVDLGIVIFTGIIAAGAAIPFTGSHLGDGTNNYNITFDTAKTLYWIDGGVSSYWQDESNWSLSSGGAGAGVGCPLPQDTAIFDANSISEETSIDYNTSAFVKNLDVSAVGYDIDFSGETYVFGNLTLSAFVTYLGVILSGDINQSITSDGAYLNIEVRKSASGTVTFLDDVLVEEMGVYSGIVDANDFNITAENGFEFSEGPFTINMGSGTWELTSYDAGWIVGEIISGRTAIINAETSTIKMSLPSDATEEYFFYGGGQTYNRLEIVNPETTDGALVSIYKRGDYLYEGDPPFTEIVFTDGIYITGIGKTVQFENEGIFTINALDADGTDGNLITLKAVDDEEPAFTLRKFSGSNITVNYCSIQNSNAEGAVDWFAVDSDDAGGNSGWLFLPLEEEFTADGIVSGRGEKTFTGDAHISTRLTNGFASDAYVASRLTLEIIGDGLVAERLTGTCVADGVVATRSLKTFTGDSIVLEQLTKTFTGDALVSATMTKEFTANAYVAQTTTVIFGADGIIIGRRTQVTPKMRPVVRGTPMMKPSVDNP